MSQTLAEYDDGLRAAHGAELIGGVDEAGRGALAGPVVAAVVLLGPGAKLDGVNDSKQLNAAERYELAPIILREARAAVIAIATAEEVDRVNVLAATHLACSRALAALRPKPCVLVTDYLKMDIPGCAVYPIARGDETSLAVAAASVLAKATRDRIMRLLDVEYPEYGFARHKGYGTPEHVAALERVGASTVHRLTFAGVCWFDQGPQIWSLSWQNGSLPEAAPTHDLRKIACGSKPRSRAHGFLPEIEYRTRGGK